MSIKVNSIKYKIIKELGIDKKNGMKVYLVLNKKDNNNYVIKEISIKNVKNEDINNIQKEAEILSKFNHNNIVKYFGSSITKEYFYILMEYCEGKDLRSFINDYIQKNQLIEEDILYNMIKHICFGIKEMHNKNIIHRDLKPENIFLNKEHEVKIGDFGISKEVESYKQYALTVNMQGTLHYIAPEILTGKKYNKKADIWSLGCIIYELVHLSNYYLDKMTDNIKKLDKNSLYNFKWQKLIELLLQVKYENRPDIKNILEFLNKIKDNEIKEEIYNLDNNIKIPKIIERLKDYELINIPNNNSIKSIYSKKKYNL